MRKKVLNIIFPVLLVLSACSHEKEEQKFMAKVGNETLTEKDFNELVSSTGSTNQHKAEIIRRWIEEELLFQESEEKGITENDRFEFLSGLNSRKLAGALLLQNYFKEHEPLISDNDLREFYEQNKSDFELNDDMFVYNLAGFSDENSAIKFRKTVVANKNNWSVDTPADSNLSEYKINKLANMHDIYPLQILRSLNKLVPGEISIIIKTEPDRYNIVQLLERMEKGSIPDFSYIKEIVKLRYKALKEKQLYNEFYQELYSKYNVEINKDYE